MSKKSLADWWEENYRSSNKASADKPLSQDDVEALYEKLGKEPAVDASLEVIRKEMAAVYRDMRSGRIDCDDGLRLAHVLDLVRKSHESTSIGQRLGAIETAIGVKVDTSPGWLGIPFDKGGT